MAERLTLSKTLDTPSDMKHFIVIIALLAICSCKTRPHRENIEVVFSPGLVDMNKIDPDIINSIKKTDKVYTITSDDYTFLHDVGAPDKPCGVGCADVNPKTVAKRYMIVQKVVSLHYESEWQ